MQEAFENSNMGYTFWESGQKLLQYAVMQNIRLDKFLSEAGFCSRKRAEEFLRLNKVLVNGVSTPEPGKRVDLRNAQIIINGKVIEKSEEKVYYVLNKQKGVV